MTPVSMADIKGFSGMTSPLFPCPLSLASGSIKGNRKTAEPISISARKEIFKKKCIHHAQKNVVVCPSYFFTPCFPWALSPSTRMGPCKKETHWACGNLTITRKVAVPASIFPICYPGERAFMVRGHQRRALQGGEKKSLQNRLLQLSSFPFSSPPFFCCIPNHKLSHLVTWAFVPRDMTFEDLKEVKRRWSREMMWGQLFSFFIAGFVRVKFLLFLSRTASQDNDCNAMRQNSDCVHFRVLPKTVSSTKH